MKNEQQNIKEVRKPMKNTWFWRYIVDNQFVSALLIILLLFIIIYVFTKISYLFEPLSVILNIVGPPVIFAVLFYYLLNPLVNRLVKRLKVKRKLAIWLVFGGILLIAALVIIFLIPVLENQLNQLVNNFPAIWNYVLIQTEELLDTGWLTELYQELQATNIIERITEQVTNVFSVTIDSIGNVFGVLGRIILTVFTMPFVLYYLLADGQRFKQGILKITPTKVRPTIQKFLSLSSRQVGSYVRGQLLVAIAVSIIFFVGYTIIDLDYALILAISAGLLNLIPYLGSIMAAIPAMILGLFISPWKFVQVLIVLAVEQFIEGRIISPQILGNELDIHPIIILFILLIAGSLFGFMGLILAIPAFGILKVVWELFFEWLNEHTDLYEESTHKN